MRRMIQGTEHEYTLFCKRMSAMGVDPHILALELLRDSDLHSAGEFVTNGSRVYYDVGHLEVSTAETSNFMDLILWEKAGEKIVDWLRKVAEEKYLGEHGRIWAFKNNTSPDGTSYGSHENYCVSRKLLFPESFMKELVPHLTTRFIYTGAGDIVEGRYVLSPMAYLTSALISGETMHNTGVLNTRDEPHALSHRWRRLHLLVGDALMNETAIMLRHFTTSAILQLMENNALEDAPRLKSPLDDMWHNVELTNPDGWRVELNDGKKVSLIDIQRYYYGKIEQIVESDEEKRALKILGEVLDDLENKRSKKLARRVEWLDRFFAIKEAVDRSDALEAEMMACKQYSEVGVERSIFYKRQKAGLVDKVVEEEAVLRAIREPPHDTRARLRSRLCEKYDVQAVDWSFVIINNGERKRINMEDPHIAELREEYAAA